MRGKSVITAELATRESGGLTNSAKPIRIWFGDHPGHARLLSLDDAERLSAEIECAILDFHEREPKETVDDEAAALPPCPRCDGKVTPLADYSEFIVCRSVNCFYGSTLYGELRVSITDHQKIIISGVC